jgi:outer membrane protein
LNYQPIALISTHLLNYMFAKTTLLLSIFGLLTTISLAQDTLSYDACVTVALENNYGIMIAKNEQDIASNNATPGNADLLPKLAVNGGVTGGVSNVNQQFLTQNDKTTIRGAKSFTETGSLDLTYNIYQGNTRINNLRNLRIQSHLSELETKNKIEETMLSIAQKYYEVAGIQANVNLIEDVLEVSNERFQRVEYKYQYGDALKIDVLNAEVNLNSDSVKYMTVVRNLTQVKKDLKILMGEEPSSNFAVNTEVKFITDLDREALKSELIEGNTLLLLADGKITKAEYNLAISKGRRHPILSTQLSYGLRGSQNDAGFLSSSVSSGLTAGLNLTFDIFDGNKKNITIQNSAIELDNSKKLKSEQELILIRDLENAWSAYTFQLNVLRLQTRNIETNKLNFERSAELYSFGQLTSTQYREAQINYLTARFDFIVSTASAKIEEIRLLRLSGQIIQ